MCCHILQVCHVIYRYHSTLEPLTAREDTKVSAVLKLHPMKIFHAIQNRHLTPCSSEVHFFMRPVPRR